jgi:hypothetical protein
MHPSQSPGAWDGNVFSKKLGKVMQSITWEKWDKVKGMIQ